MPYGSVVFLLLHIHSILFQTVAEEIESTTIDLAKLIKDIDELIKRAEEEDKAVEVVVATSNPNIKSEDVGFLDEIGKQLLGISSHLENIYMSLLSANSGDETSTKPGENTTPRTKTFAVSTANTSSTLKTSTTANATTPTITGESEESQHRTKAAKQNTTVIQIQTTKSAQATTFKQNAGTNTTDPEEAFPTQSSHRTTNANRNTRTSLSTTTGHTATTKKSKVSTTPTPVHTTAKRNTMADQENTTAISEHQQHSVQKIQQKANTQQQCLDLP